MAADEKDRLGDTLHKKEKAEEDRFFAERDRELIERLRKEKTTRGEAEVRDVERGRCPKCGTQLVAVDHHGVTVEECPSCGGMWLDKGELQTLAARERDSWLGRFFFRPKR